MNTYIKIKGVWHYLYRAVDKHGHTLDWMLSTKRNKKSAKRFFKKMINNRHVPASSIINVDKNLLFPPAHRELIVEGNLPKSTIRQVKYLNNIIENDHKFVKRQSRYRQCYQSFTTAVATISGMETMGSGTKNKIVNNFCKCVKRCF
jgi:IS6 family transposase